MMGLRAELDAQGCTRQLSFYHAHIIMKIRTERSLAVQVTLQLYILHHVKQMHVILFHVCSAQCFHDPQL